MKPITEGWATIRFYLKFLPALDLEYSQLLEMGEKIIKFLK